MTHVSEDFARGEVARDSSIHSDAVDRLDFASNQTSRSRTTQLNARLRSSASTRTWGLRGRGRIAVLAALCAVSGCTTSQVLSAWRDGYPIEQFDLELVSADPSEVRVRWNAVYEGNRSGTGLLEFDPELDGCFRVTVHARYADNEKQLRVGAPVGMLGEQASSGRTPPGFVERCALDLGIETESRALTLAAASRGRRLGSARIEPPRNHLWLGAMPLTLAVDTVGGLVGFGIWACLEGGCEGSWTP